MGRSLLLALVLGSAPAHAGSIGYAGGCGDLSPPPSAPRFGPSLGYPDAGEVDTSGATRGDFAASYPVPVGTYTLDPMTSLSGIGIGGPFEAGPLTPGLPESILARTAVFASDIRLGGGARSVRGQGLA